MEGAGVHLGRVFGNSGVPELDPFLLLDDFRSNEPRYYLKGFPWHPHRGIETITYFIDGNVEHGNSMGNKGVEIKVICGEVEGTRGPVTDAFSLFPENQLANLWPGTDPS